jgi:hypothetical protein
LGINTSTRSTSFFHRAKNTPQTEQQRKQNQIFRTSDDEPSELEKCLMLEKSLEMIDLGLGEAHVMAALAGIDFTKLHFGPKVYGQIFTLKFWTNFRPKTSPSLSDYYVQ